MGHHSDQAPHRRHGRRATLTAAIATAAVGLGMSLVLGAGGASADGPPSPIGGLPLPPIPILPAPAPPSKPAPGHVTQPEWAAGLPAATTQVIRTTYSHQWCSQVYCTKTEAWEKVDGAWRLAAGPGVGGKAVFRSTSVRRGSRRSAGGAPTTAVPRPACTRST